MSAAEPPPTTRLAPKPDPPAGRRWEAERRRLHEVIYEADTPAGRRFDTLLLVAILASVAVVALDSVPEIRARWGPVLVALEWTFTVLFTIEYALRLWTVRRPMAYATSFYGVVDLLAILPSYLSLVVPGTERLLVIRILRLMRVFRVFKLAEYLREARALRVAMRASGRKIAVFLLAVSGIVVITGAVMHLVEGPEHGFTSNPTGVYWAIVTLTTVGFGDVAPVTPLGRFIASLVMLLGYAIIAVPTGIVSAELVRGATQVTTEACEHCGTEIQSADALYCRRCGHRLEDDPRAGEA